MKSLYSLGSAIVRFVDNLGDNNNNPPSTSEPPGHCVPTDNSSANTSTDKDTKSQVNDTTHSETICAETDNAQQNVTSKEKVGIMEAQPSTSNCDSAAAHSSLELTPTKELDFEMLSLNEAQVSPEQYDTKDKMPVKSQLFKETATSSKVQPDQSAPVKLENLKLPQMETAASNETPAQSSSSAKESYQKDKTQSATQSGEFEAYPRYTEETSVAETRPSPKGKLFCDFIKESFPAPIKPPPSAIALEVDDDDINPYPATQTYNPRQNQQGQSRNQKKKEKKKKNQNNAPAVEVDDSEINPYPARQISDAHQFQGQSQLRFQPRNQNKSGGNQPWRKSEEVEDWDINPYYKPGTSRGQPTKSQNNWKPPQQNNVQRPDNMVLPWKVSSNASSSSFGGANYQKTAPAESQNYRGNQQQKPWQQKNQGSSYGAAARSGGNSYNRGPPKELYKASSIQELENKAKQFKFDFRRQPKDLLRLSKMFVQHGDDNFANGDEERAYLEYMKYVRLCMQALEHPNVGVDTSNLQRCMANTEKLADSLKARYEKAQAKQVPIQSVPSTSQQEPVLSSTIPLLPSVPTVPLTTSHVPAVNPQLVLAQLLSSQVLPSATGLQAPLTPQEIAFQILTGGQPGGNSVNTALPSATGLQQAVPLTPQEIAFQILNGGQPGGNSVNTSLPSATGLQQAVPLTPQEIATQILIGGQPGGNSVNTLLALVASLSAQNNNTGTAPLMPGAALPATPLSLIPPTVAPAAQIPVPVPATIPLVPEVKPVAPSTSAQNEPKIIPATTSKPGGQKNFPRKQQKPESSDESEEDEDEVPGIEGKPWKSAKGGTVPTGAIEGGKNHLGPIYVARFKHNGKLVPGKLIPTYGSCYITWKTKEVKNKDYEVLCDNNVGWMKVKQGSPSCIPGNAIFGGQDENGEPLYIGRVKHQSSITSGKVDGNMSCWVLYGSAEHEYKDFELLVAVNSSGRGEQGSSGRSGYSRPPRNNDDDSSNSRSSKYGGQQGKNQSKTNGKVGGFFSSWRGKQRSGGEEPQEIVAASFLTESFSKHIPAMQLLDGVKDGSTVDVKFKLTLLANTDKDYIEVSQKMQGSITKHPNVSLTQYNILKIEKVWNTKLWSMYAYSLKKIKEENKGKVNERRLFHGSGKCLDIVEKGFDERHARAGMFGAGVYFADHSSKSHQYTSGSPRMMMLCRVALGSIMEHTGAQSYSHAPPGYHSVKGVPGVSLNYAEYIVYRGEQTTFYFILHFSFHVCSH